MSGRPTLEQWSFKFVARGPFQAPELNGLIGEGLVYGSHRDDGTPISTSFVENIDYEGGSFTTASGTVYALGEPSPEYRTWVEVTRPDLADLFGWAPPENAS